MSRQGSGCSQEVVIHPPRRRALGGILFVSALFVACSDVPTTPDLPLSPALSALRSTSTEHAALDELTQAVALALGDPALRQRLKRDLRASRHTIEHKLEVRSYFEGQAGRTIVDQMAVNRATNRNYIVDLIRATRPLEMYMPIDEHREAWTGGELLVAAQIEESEPAFIYDTNGNRVEMDPRDAAESPVPILALVPVETDFTQVLDLSSYENTNDLGGVTIGTYSSREGSYSVVALIDDCDTCVDCPPECTGEEPPPPPPAWRWADLPTGIYITHIQIPDDHEGCCLKGDPEFEIHLHAPNQDPKTAEDLRCTGQHAPDTRSRYDMNDQSWATSASRRPILLADSVQQARFRASYGQDVGMGIIGWEDDDTACKVKADPDRLRRAFQAAIAAAPSAHAAIQKPTDANILKALPGVANVVLGVASWLKSNDDVVGISYKPSGTCSISGKVGFKMTDDNDRNKGCVVLKAHDRRDY